MFYDSFSFMWCGISLKIKHLGLRFRLLQFELTKRVGSMQAEPSKFADKVFSLSDYEIFTFQIRFPSFSFR